MNDQDLTEESNTAKTVDIRDTSNKITVTNTFKTLNVDDTGILLNYAPYAAMILLATASVLGYGRMRRKFTV